MLDGTYTGLLATLATMLNRSDLTSRLPDYIVLAEGEMNRGITARRQVTRTTLTIASEYVSLPADFSGARVMRLTSGTHAEIPFIGPEQMADKKDQDTSTGEPQEYSIVGSSFEFYPPPDGSYTAVLSYYQSIPSLATSGSNWLLSSYPDVYLNGAMKYAFVNMKDDARAQEMDALFQRSMDQVNDQSVIESIPGLIQPGASSGMVI
jgi:hypothetical protein